MTRVFVFGWIALAAWGQAVPDAAPAQPRLLENSGQPMQLSFRCTDDDIQYFGLTCTEDEPCPIYLELTALEPIGSKLFVVGNIHASATTLYSVVLATSDAGKTWTEPYERIRGAGLDHIQFVDFEYGWITGQNLHPLPADPFLLLSSDGGRAWRKRAVFDDNRVGSIQQIWFDSRTSGSLVFDRGQPEDGPRYELHESSTGGESWMVREASDKPIRIRRMPEPEANPDWRLHPHAPTKSFRIEKRQSAHWTAVAGFLVNLGGCTPAPFKPVEPPPEATTAPQQDFSTFQIGQPKPKPPVVKRPPK